MNDSEIGRSTTYNHDIEEKYKRDGEGNGGKVVQSAEIAKDRRFREGCRGNRVDAKVSWFDLCAGNETSGQWRNAAEPLLETRYMHGAPRRYKGTTTPASTLRSSVSPSLWPPLHNYSVEATTSPPLDRTIPVHPSSYTTPLNPSTTLSYLVVPTYTEFSTLRSRYLLCVRESFPSAFHLPL